MLQIKKGVSISGMRPEILLAVNIAHAIYLFFDFSLTITSHMDGKHSTGSLHYVGLAVDIRTRHIPKETIPKIVTKLKASLGLEYDVILHSTHIHIEFQPK